MGSISLRRRGLWLEYATLGWNVIGTVIVLIAAVRAGSSAWTLLANAYPAPSPLTRLSEGLLGVRHG